MPRDIEALEQLLAAAQDRERQLQAKLALAETAHAAAMAERRLLLVDGDLVDAKALADIDRRVVEAESGLAGLSDAVRLAINRTAEAQRQADDARDQAQRQAEAEKVRALVADIDKAVRPLSRAAAACEQVLRAAGPICPEALAVAGLLRSSQQDLQIYIQQALSDLRGYAAAVERGGKLRRTISNEPASKIQTPKPVTQRVFFIEHAKWTADGRVITARQFSTHDLPASLAEKAIGCALAVEPTHETAAKLRPIFGDGCALPADPAICIDLDTLDASIDLRRVSAQVILAKQAKETAA